MALKKLHIDTAIIWIDKRRNEGKSNQEIYGELTKAYTDKDAIAKLIAQTLTKEQKDEYRTLNNILFILLVLSAIFKLGFGAAFAQNLHEYLFVILIPMLNIYFAYVVFKFRVSDYGNAIKIILLSCVHLLFEAKNKEDITPIIVNVVFSLLIVALFAFLSTAFSAIQQHEFEKDINGEYIIK